MSISLRWDFAWLDLCIKLSSQGNVHSWCSSEWDRFFWDLLEEHGSALSNSTQTSVTIILAFIKRWRWIESVKIEHSDNPTQIINISNSHWGRVLDQIYAEFCCTVLFLFPTGGCGQRCDRTELEVFFVSHICNTNCTATAIRVSQVDLWVSQS